jgi:hypothetical protein
MPHSGIENGFSVDYVEREQAILCIELNLHGVPACVYQSMMHRAGGRDLS